MSRSFFIATFDTPLYVLLTTIIPHPLARSFRRTPTTIISLFPVVLSNEPNAPDFHCSSLPTIPPQNIAQTYSIVVVQLFRLRQKIVFLHHRFLE